MLQRSTISFKVCCDKCPDISVESIQCRKKLIAVELPHS